MTQYRAKPGMEDRHGEMTGAISINMMLSMLPVVLWVFLAPLVVESESVRFWTAVVMAVVLPIAFLPLSRRIWAWVSEWMEGDLFQRNRRDQP